MALGYDQPLYILAFDHRGSFQKKFFGVTGEPNAEEAKRISDAKRVIYEGAVRALSEGVDAASAGVLVDEQFGADIARDAKANGLALAMPVELDDVADPGVRLRVHVQALLRDVVRGQRLEAHAGDLV